jgi:hypothetical protein
MVVPLPALNNRYEDSDVVVFLDVNDQSVEHKSISRKVMCVDLSSAIEIMIILRARSLGIVQEDSDDLI